MIGELLPVFSEVEDGCTVGEARHITVFGRKRVDNRVAYIHQTLFALTVRRYPLVADGIHRNVGILRRHKHVPFVVTYAVFAVFLYALQLRSIVFIRTAFYQNGV